MAPGQAPHQSAPWRGTHPFFLLSPLMGLLSRAWSHLRGPGPPEPWLLEPVARADHGEAGLEGAAQTFVGIHCAPEGRHFQGETGDGEAVEDDGDAFRGACHDLKASSSLLEAWGLSDADDEEDQTTGVPQEQASDFVGGQPAPLSPTLPVRALQDPPGEEKSEEGGAAGTEMVTFFSLPPSPWECCPGEEGEEGGAIKKEAARAPAFPLSPGSTPKARGYRAGEEEGQATEGRRTENKEATKSSIFPSSSGFHARAWERGSGEESEEEEDESSDSEAAEEEGETEGPSSIPSTNPFIRGWVYRPGEDTEEEDENEDDEDSEATDSALSPSLQAQSALLGGEDTEGREVAKQQGEAEPRPFRVAIYLPGERPPPPWAPPRLPVRLQRRLKSTETPTRHPDPEPPVKARKVRFSEKVSVHLLAVWAGPARAARRGPWEQLARDRSRFARRIAQAQEQLGPCLTPAARARAWARFGNPTPPLAATPAPTQILPLSSVQATALSPVTASPFAPLSLSPGLDLSGRRG
ncbi:protein phosphatase 1 regulatory subunit 15A isoform X2 [Prionailurus bengalensis]|uniref:protein phosphatase 1 regulatory subunit 15A isoform X2 n=1 Tax=Prionailurus bengalensis TaxID=37029 RepID=UPI001CA891FA|nr:protein phosphatase 1 regulatory subunit 15A isoform X2 [Prionailurus bengalensis]XP_043456290.1 protein phosphatase 1 regulatory subunit 15A isoform X2 [Prionailurus bengalensis]